MLPRKGVLLALCLLSLTGCGQKKSTQQLLSDLASAEERERIVSVRLLPERKGDASQIVPGLVKALADKHGDIRRSAAIGLGSFGAQASEAIPALQACQNDRDARVREAARVALSRIDPKAFPAMAQSGEPKKP